MKIEARWQALNFAVGSMLPHLAAWEMKQEQAQVFVRAIAFADDAWWHIAEPLPVRNAKWVDLSYVEKGETSMGAAFRLVSEALEVGKLEARALRPAIVLITDGRPSDPAEFKAGLETLLSTPGGQAAIRVAVAIGRSANSGYLSQFISDPSMGVLVADNVDQITDQLVAASLAVSRMSEVGVDRDSIALSQAPADEDSIV
jgi:uncharacterized protein YegL